MPANIEIKARARDFQRQRKIAERISETPGVEFTQEDVFFNTPEGRLKLRLFADGTGELIFYTRADEAGPRVSHYLRCGFRSPQSVREMLASSAGVRGTVRKTRTLYKVGNTRIHFDRVEGLGDFIELEFVMGSSLAGEDGTRIGSTSSLDPSCTLNRTSTLDGTYREAAAADASGRSEEAGTRGALVLKDLMQKLEIAPEDLLDKAYIDLLAKDSQD
ncbi:MAG: class IV adenylate cyclase [Candidatus Eisenbacteria bacterium]